MFDGALFGAEVVDAVRGYMERAVQPLQAEVAELRAKLAELEAREPLPSIITAADMAAFDAKFADLESKIAQSVQDTYRAHEALERGLGERLLSTETPLVERIAALEAREPLKGEPGEPGLDGKDADLGAVVVAAVDLLQPVLEERLQQLSIDDDKVAAELAKWLEANPPANGQDGAMGERGADGVPGEPGPAGKDAEPIAMEAIADAVATYLQANPPAAGQDGAPGADGFSIDPAEVELMVGAMVERRVAELPAPLPGPAGEKGEPGEPGERGAPGVDGVAGPVITGAIKDHTGELVITFTDGMVLRTGIFDGVNGRDGEKGEPGFMLEDFDSEVRDGGRTLVLSFTAGDTRHTVEHQIDTMIYRGAYKAGDPYLPGDTVSCGGQLYHCGEATNDRPDGDSAAWTLCSRRGRDGKDADIIATEAKLAKGLADMEERMIKRLEAYLKSKGV